MKSYIFKMVLSILIISSLIIVYKEKNSSELIGEYVIINNIMYRSEYNSYDEPAIYEGLTLKELGTKIDKVFNSTLEGYGATVASIALESEVDPIIAASIILVETGCKWSCSSLVKNSNNVGVMRVKNGYMKFDTLEEGLQAFINNLAKNYYAKGLDTPELMNKKYATNPNWYKDVYYYIDLIKAS